MTAFALLVNWWLISCAAFLGLLASELAGHRFKPDHHPFDAVQEVTVRLAHIAVGLMIVVILCATYFLAAREFPDKWPLLAACCAGPAAFEAAQYRRFGGLLIDKIKDTADMCAAPLACCLGITWAGGGNFTGQIGPPALVALASAASISFSWWSRR
jgi:hypothetical protein